jgi:O-antigen ligase
VLVIPALAKRRNIGTTALLITGAVISIMAVIPAQSWDRVFTIRDQVLTGTMTNRTTIWSAGLRQFAEHPVLGVGAGAFPTAVQYVDHGIPMVAHNTYLSILVQLGVVGAILISAILGIAWRRILSMQGARKRLWAISLLTWCIGVFGLTWEYKKMTWLLFALIIGQARTYHSESTETSSYIVGYATRPFAHTSS